MSKTELSVHGSVFEKGKPYIAEVTGLDKKFGLKRDFVAARKSSSKSGRTWNLTARVVDGIYELSDTGKREAERRYVEVRDGLKTTLTIEEVEARFEPAMIQQAKGG